MPDDTARRRYDDVNETVTGVRGREAQHDKSVSFSFIVQSRECVATGPCWTTPTTKRRRVLQTFFLSLMITGRMRAPLLGCSAGKSDSNSQRYG